jgi:hypothetical protein
MRESPSGAANPHGSTLLDGNVFGGNAYSSFVVPCDGAKVGDSVAYSFDPNVGSFGPVCVTSVGCSSNQVIFNVYNLSAAPYTVHNLNVYVEAIPAG